MKLTVEINVVGAAVAKLDKLEMHVVPVPYKGYNDSDEFRWTIATNEGFAVSDVYSEWDFENKLKSLKEADPEKARKYLSLAKISIDFLTLQQPLPVPEEEGDVQ